MASGTPFTNALVAGAMRVFGNGCLPILLMTRIWSTGWSTVRLCGRIHQRQARQKKGGQAKQALGRSRGGFSSKIHLLVDGLGNPLRVLLTAGQTADIRQAQPLVSGFEFNRVLADRGYAAQYFYDWLREQDIEPVIPPHQCAKGDKAQRPFDRWWYRERHLVECFIGKIKHFRRVFSRFDKLAVRYLSFVQFVSALIWLR